MLLIGDENVPVALTQQNRWGGWVMARRSDGWCAALDRNTMLCTIYPVRPQICRDYESGASDCLDQRVAYGVDTGTKVD